MKIEVNYNAKRDELTLKLFKPFENAPKEWLTPFMEELDEKPEVHQALVKMGCKSMTEELRQYMICLYGGNDDKTDVSDASTNQDYCHCGKRNGCPVFGTEGLCSIPVIDNKPVTPIETATMTMMCQEDSVKIIAEKRNRSPHTVARQIMNLRKKFKVFTSVGIVVKAIRSGVV